jgi:Domain of Unknown Function (DUF1259)
MPCTKHWPRAKPHWLPRLSTAPPGIGLDTAELDRIVGVKGKTVGGVYQFAVARRESITEGGMSLEPAAPLGMATGVNFQPTGNGRAAITGDFVLVDKEVNPVIRALRANGIEVTALHSHMLDEQPRMFLCTSGRNDDAKKLAKGQRLDLPDALAAVAAVRARAARKRADCEQDLDGEPS